ncbi:MAG: YafY family transcriptional regulator [Candidatus Sericytochromatia bacterium]|nr:YafY family transcriptional regulator [Candidatus Sericytochromatia bacterium]
MRRTERLFQIIQLLRGRHRPLTAQALAAELETSVRTIYRDIAELQAQRVPIRGVAGVGYCLEKGYDLPPLMLTPAEIEAAVLGAQWASTRGDLALARSARDLLNKIRDVVPSHLRSLILESTVMAVNQSGLVSDQLELGKIREAIRHREKLKLRYADHLGMVSERVIWPICVAYFEAVRLLVGWCELRREFRHFRTDRIQQVDFLAQTYPAETQSLLRAWREEEKRKNACLAFHSLGLESEFLS